MHIKDYIEKAMELKASDLHITVFRRPTFRVNGRLISYEEHPVLTPDDTAQLAAQLIPDEKNRQHLDEYGQADFSNSFPGLGRFRVNVYKQRGSYAAAIRLIPFHIPSLEELGMPPVVKDLAMLDKGLVLVTGPTGSGKSTTLAAMINHLNKVKDLHIITLEDPIEYLHRHERCIINQREVGSDTNAFAEGLRAALRQDPDVILVGEMRDLDTIATAVTAAETGHLVLATLHSNSAAQAVDRIIDVFPPHQQSQIRIQLASTLQGVLAQQLIPAIDGSGRVLAQEIMVVNSAIKNLIRDGKSHQIISAIQTGASLGMMTMDRALKILHQQGKISYEELSKRVSNREAL